MTSGSKNSIGYPLPAMLGPGPTIQELLDQESGPVPPVLRDTSAVDFGTKIIYYRRGINGQGESLAKRDKPIS